MNPRGKFFPYKLWAISSSRRSGLVSPANCRCNMRIVFVDRSLKGDTNSERAVSTCFGGISPKTCELPPVPKPATVLFFVNDLFRSHSRVAKNLSPYLQERVEVHSKEESFTFMRPSDELFAQRKFFFSACTKKESQFWALSFLQRSEKTVKTFQYTLCAQCTLVIH